MNKDQPLNIYRAAVTLMVDVQLLKEAFSDGELPFSPIVRGDPGKLTFIPRESIPDLRNALVGLGLIKPRRSRSSYEARPTF